ncbi:hypothetical protein GCM10023238_10790 [Streptomyces heliomycini]
MSTDTTASVSTHVLDTSAGRPAGGVAVRLAARSGRDADWRALGGRATDADGRCGDLPALPEGTTHVRLDFAVEAYFAQPAGSRAEARRDGGAHVFFRRWRSRSPSYRASTTTYRCCSARSATPSTEGADE